MDKKERNTRKEGDISSNSNSNFLNNFLNKKIFVILKSGRLYSGEVLNIENKTIFLNDKFDNLIMFNTDEVSSIEPARDKKEFIKT